MRHLIYFFVAALLIFQTTYGQKQENEIGTVKNGRYVITTDKSNLKKIFDKHLSNIGIKASVKTIEIKKGNIAHTKENYYMLLAENASHNVKAAIDLKLRNSVFIATYADETFEFICVCSGCDKGCMPQRAKEENEKVWQCSPCKGSQNNKIKRKCIKSETVTEPATS